MSTWFAVFGSLSSRDAKVLSVSRRSQFSCFLRIDICCVKYRRSWFAAACRQLSRNKRTARVDQLFSAAPQTLQGDYGNHNS